MRQERRDHYKPHSQVHLGMAHRISSFGNPNEDSEDYPNQKQVYHL